VAQACGSVQNGNAPSIVSLLAYQAKLPKLSYMKPELLIYIKTTYKKYYLARTIM